MDLQFHRVGDGVWEEDATTDPQFQICVREGWGVVMRDLVDEMLMTGGEVDILNNEGEKVATLTFQPHAAAEINAPLPDWFVLIPVTDLCASYWTSHLDIDDNRKGEGCWLVEEEDGERSCACPRYHDCIQFEPPYGCANCDEKFSQFCSKADWERGVFGAN